MYLKSGIKKECVGCEACANICPCDCLKMICDDEGFFYPSINKDKCINCGLCLNVCPIQADHQSCNVKKIYAVKHKDRKIQMESSSGVAFSALAEKIIADGGKIYASCFNDNKQVEFKKIENLSALKEARKSKYVQSKMNNVHLDIYKDLTNGETKVLFVGTACQVDSVKKYLRQKKCNIDNLYLVDIICHGVASPMIWKKYLEYQEHIYKAKITMVDFRNKGYGWTPMRMKLLFKNNEIYESSSRFDGYYRLFFGHYIIRPACHVCKYTNLDRESDITIADFWGIDEIDPEMYDFFGVSMALSNSQKGEDMIEKIKDNAVVKEVFCDNLHKYQPNLMRPTPENKKRGNFWKIYKKRGFDKAYKKFGIMNKKDIIIDDFKNNIKRVIRHGKNEADK